MKFVSTVLVLAAATAATWVWSLKASSESAPPGISPARAPASVSPAITEAFARPASAPAARPVEPAALRDESLRQLAAQRATSDIRSALLWIKSLPAADRAVAVEAVLAQIGQSDPAGAIALGAAFQVGVNDGRLERLAQLWTEEKPAEATTWIAALPADETRDRLLARSARVRAAHDAAEAIRLVGLMSAGVPRDTALMEVVQQWKLYDPAAANEALASFPTLAADASRR